MSNPQRPPLIITTQPVMSFNQPVVTKTWQYPEIQRGSANAISLLELLHEGGVITAFIAGGYARFCISERENPPLPGDLDVFFSRESDWEKACFILQGSKFVEVISTKNAITYNPPKTVEWEWIPPVQLIAPSCKMLADIVPEGRSMRAILERFDLNIAQAAVFLDESGTLKSMASESFLLDDAKNQVTLNHIVDPFNVICRLCKYSAKGFSVSKATIARILQCLHDMPLEARENYIGEIMRIAHPY